MQLMQNKDEVDADEDEVVADEDEVVADEDKVDFETDSDENVSGYGNAEEVGGTA